MSKVILGHIRKIYTRGRKVAIAEFVKLLYRPVRDNCPINVQAAMRDGKDMSEEVKALLREAAGAAGGICHPAVAPIR